jgi:polyisoprenoid-binding protein YceI
MDAKMYDALKTRKNPEIKYTLTEIGAVRDTGADRFVFDTKGELTIAGTTRTLEMPMTVEILDEKRLRIGGKTAMRMSDFNVPRPQAMGGMIKSGDRVEVAVQWVVSQ